MSRFRGISIDLSDENENASSLMRVNCDCNSNKIDLTILQLDQQFAAKTAIESGIHPRRK
jgi:hypothetical protein